MAKTANFTAQLNCRRTCPNTLQTRITNGLPALVLATTQLSTSRSSEKNAQNRLMAKRSAALCVFVYSHVPIVLHFFAHLSMHSFLTQQ